ncbi:protein Skeletor, isoforms B/C-like isoform X2 [Scylla paramamosain]|uniref:protein Skeletor, isoforms B/C-like isoform X2 n=1 Tax=Scylla paramamosain TaxID=85552 RepID=UPI003083B1C5
MSWARLILLVFVGFTLHDTFGQQQQKRDRRKGAYIGQLQTLQHEVSGKVWAVDEDKLFIENFTFDGRSPDTFFWIGNGSQPNPKGHLVRYPLDSPDEKPVQLSEMKGQDILLHLPPRLKITDMDWFSVWFRRFTINYGHVHIPSDLEPPRKRVLPEFQRLAHQLRSGNITILDARTFYIPNLHYDGKGPDAYFWVGKGTDPDPMGHKIPNEMGSLDVLRAYEGEDIELQLPENLTVYDIDYLAVWCVAYKHNFGHVQIPPADDLWVPPALGQTRIKPHWWYSGETGQSHIAPPEFGNCRQLSPHLQVEWQAREEEVHVRLTAVMGEDEYIAFGLSPNSVRPQMLNSDIVIAYYDHDDGSFHAIDYTVTAKKQCTGKIGVCPDERVNGRNDASVISGERKNGVTIITFERPYKTNDPMDIPISRASEQRTVIAAIGPLSPSKEASYHEDFITDNHVQLDFKSVGDNTCNPKPGAGPESPRYPPWEPRVLRAITNFTATIGPTGGDRGYSLVTSPSQGYRSWNLAWWIEDKLIPEIYVERGQTYYFTVHGGNDHSDIARYHPLYITSSPEGGFNMKTSEEQQNERIFAGVAYSKLRMPEPTAVGSLCQWKHIGQDMWQQSETFETYKDSLYKSCDSGLPGSLVWTVAEDTPDLVYYQCYSHRNMGWKIHVVDSGYKQPRKGDNGGVSLTSSPFVLLSSFLLFLFLQPSTSVTPLALTPPLR